eukprot:12148906-Alexandrium_andersonii.AAC.1
MVSPRQTGPRPNAGPTQLRWGTSRAPESWNCRGTGAQCSMEKRSPSPSRATWLSLRRTWA